MQSHREGKIQDLLKLFIRIESSSMLSEDGKGSKEDLRQKIEVLQCSDFRFLAEEKFFVFVWGASLSRRVTMAVFSRNHLTGM